MKKISIRLLVICSFVFALFLLFNNRAYQTITFFPIDYDTSFNEKSTNLSLSPKTKDSGYEINWQTHSKTNEPLYLRQDISLLYNNGKLKGVKSKWKNNRQALDMLHKELSDTRALWEAISYHHGEVHSPDHEIKSSHFITKDSLYVNNSNPNGVRFFKTANNQTEQDFKETIDKEIKQKLIKHWDRLIKHFNINLEEYFSFPLTEIDIYNNKPFPTFNQRKTDQVIGQMWEGLYKNYIIPMTESKSKQLNNYIPLILLAKNNDHLIILYELNGKKEILIQHIVKK